MRRSDHTYLVHQVVWFETLLRGKRGKGKKGETVEQQYTVKSDAIRSEAIAQLHAMKMSAKNNCRDNIAVVHEWQVGDGMEDFCIRTLKCHAGNNLGWFYRCKERKYMTRPTSDPELSKVPGTAVETFPELPKCLDRKVNGIVTRTYIKPQETTKMANTDVALDVLNDGNGEKTKTRKAKEPKAAVKKAKAAVKEAKAATKKATEKKIDKKAPGKKTVKKAATVKREAKPREAFKGKAPSGNFKTVSETLSLREGSKIYNVMEALFQNKGKAVSVATLLKAAWDSTSEENRGNLGTILGALRSKLGENKLSMRIENTIDDKSNPAYGIFAA